MTTNLWIISIQLIKELACIVILNLEGNNGVLTVNVINKKAEYCGFHPSRNNTTVMYLLMSNLNILKANSFPVQISVNAIANQLGMS